MRMKSILEVPKGAKAILVLAHGAGAGMRHPFMSKLAEALNERAIATFRFEFPYMARGSKRPDSPHVATAAVADAVAAAGEALPKLPLFAGGKSFGGRMTTTAAAQGKISAVRGIVCFGFPLHPPKKPGITRAAHLADLPVPALLLQGTRDDLADLALVRAVVKKHPKRLRLHVVQGADHAFHVLKKSGRSDAEVLAELAAEASAFCLK